MSDRMALTICLMILVGMLYFALTGKQITYDFKENEKEKDNKELEERLKKEMDEFHK